jgi:hypothetical protein
MAGCVVGGPERIPGSSFLARCLYGLSVGLGAGTLRRRIRSRAGLIAWAGVHMAALRAGRPASMSGATSGSDSPAGVGR